MGKPASTSYQLQKFARRHKGLVAGVAAVFFSLLVGVVISTSEAVRARRAEARDLLAQASVTTGRPEHQTGPRPESPYCARSRRRAHRR